MQASAAASDTERNDIEKDDDTPYSLLTEPKVRALGLTQRATQPPKIDANMEHQTLSKNHVRLPTVPAELTKHHKGRRISNARTEEKGQFHH